MTWAWRDWAAMVVTDCAVFPKGAHDDIPDSCLSGDTGIITDHGVVPIIDVKVGDRVMTHKGRWRRVTAVGSRSSDHYYRLKAKGLDEIKVTGEHPALAMTVAVSFSEPPYKRSYGVQWKAVADLKSRPFNIRMRDGKPVRNSLRVKHDALVLTRGDASCRTIKSRIDLMDYWPTALADDYFIYIRRDCAHRVPHGIMEEIAATQAASVTLSAAARSFGVSIPTVVRAYSGGHLQLPRFDKTARYLDLDEDAGWALGLFAAEGCVAKKCMHWACDPDALNRVKAWIDRTFGRSGAIRKGHGCHKLQLFALAAVPLFAEFGRGAANKIVPPWVFDAPDEFVRGFVDGFSHGDGCRSAKWPHRIVLTSTSESLLWGVRLLLSRLGIPAFKSATKKAGPRKVFGNISQCQTAYSVGYSTASHSSTVVDDAYTGTHIEVCVRVDKPLTVYNLSVEEDESYVTVGGTLHNCSMALKHLREIGLAIRREERQFAEEELARERPKKGGVADGYFA